MRIHTGATTTASSSSTGSKRRAQSDDEVSVWLSSLFLPPHILLLLDCTSVMHALHAPHPASARRGHPSFMSNAICTSHHSPSLPFIPLVIVFRLIPRPRVVLPSRPCAASPVSRVMQRLVHAHPLDFLAPRRALASPFSRALLSVFGRAWRYDTFSLSFRPDPLHSYPRPRLRLRALLAALGRGCKIFGRGVPPLASGLERACLRGWHRIVQPKFISRRSQFRRFAGPFGHGCGPRVGGLRASTPRISRWPFPVAQRRLPAW